MLMLPSPECVEQIHKVIPWTCLSSLRNDLIDGLKKATHFNNSEGGELDISQIFHPLHLFENQNKKPGNTPEK